MLHLAFKDLQKWYILESVTVSVIVILLSHLVLILSLTSEFGGGTGWTLIPPLSTYFMPSPPSSTGISSEMPTLCQCTLGATCICIAESPLVAEPESPMPKNSCASYLTQVLQRPCYKRAMTNGQRTMRSPSAVSPSLAGGHPRPLDTTLEFHQTGGLSS